MFHKITFILIAVALLTVTIAQSVDDFSEVAPEAPENETIIPLEDPSSFVDLNITITNQTSIENTTEVANSTKRFVNCLPNLGNSNVEIVNDTVLIKLLHQDTNVTSRDTPGACVLVLFYSLVCPFSSMAAPHFNALPRAFPDIKMVAINAMIHHIFNTQHGIVGVPSLMLFHSGRPVAKYNESEYTLDLFSKFLTTFTSITAKEKSFVASADFSGPVVSQPSANQDIFLIWSWLFILVCGGYYFTKSKWWTWIVEAIKSNWRESEDQAQHEHVD